MNPPNVLSGPEPITCPECGWTVFEEDGEILTHGPAKDGGFICPGSGMVVREPFIGIDLST